ncbi:hypothetical protein COO60DRAFT_570760 [Scenedesmus sp. NREL 46B-D3]|nr:hypothetical protein COO60DRAFT_570760 [Scenedesmus sp. NREL 46B-D3]
MRLASGGSSLPQLLAPRHYTARPAVAAPPAVQHSSRLRLRCRATTDLAKFADKSYLDKAAKRFKLGVEQGLEEDFLVAIELGATSREQLTEAQLEYVDKIKEKLIKRAAELSAEEADRKKREAAYLEAGKMVRRRMRALSAGLAQLRAAAAMSGRQAPSRAPGWCSGSSSSSKGRQSVLCWLVSQSVRQQAGMLAHRAWCTAQAWLLPQGRQAATRRAGAHARRRLGPGRPAG